MAALKFKVGDTVSLNSSPACRMTVARVPSAANQDLLKPQRFECVWLDNNHQVQFGKFPLAMLQAAPKQPIGFKINSKWP